MQIQAEAVHDDHLNAARILVAVARTPMRRSPPRDDDDDDDDDEDVNVERGDCRRRDEQTTAASRDEQTTAASRDSTVVSAVACTTIAPSFRHFENVARIVVVSERPRRRRIAVACRLAACTSLARQRAQRRGVARSPPRTRSTTSVECRRRFQAIGESGG